MIRCNLVEGDQSSANGVTLEGMPQDTINGKRMAFLGARVYCPTCRTTGQIVGVGPRHPSDFMTSPLGAIYTMGRWVGIRTAFVPFTNIGDSDLGASVETLFWEIK